MPTPVTVVAALIVAIGISSATAIAALAAPASQIAPYAAGAPSVLAPRPG